MLRRLYDWTLRLAERRGALWALAVIAFAESSFFPIPPDLLLIPMAIARPRKAWLLALVTTMASVAGGVAGYGVGYFLFDQIGRPLLAFYQYMDAFAQFQTVYQEWGAWIVFAGGLTPIPYKVITVASGVAELDLAVFTMASFVGRGARFFLVAALLYWFGPAIRRFIEARLALLTVLVFVAALLGFVALRYLF